MNRKRRNIPFYLILILSWSATAFGGRTGGFGQVDGNLPASQEGGIARTTPVHLNQTSVRVSSDCPPNSLAEPALAKATSEIVSHLSPVFTFGDLYNKYITPENNPCFASRAELEEDSLRTLKAALNRFGAKVPAEGQIAKMKFPEKIKALWEPLIESVYKHDHPTASENEIAKVVADDLVDVTSALNGSVIPLPTFEDTVRSNENKAPMNLFTLGALSEYFFLGVAPVSVGKLSPSELDQRKEHPLNRSFFDDNRRLLKHDLQHASAIIAGVKRNQGIVTSAECQQYRQCLNAALTKIDGLPRDKRANMRRALFFMHHEVSTVAQFHMTNAVRPGVLLDFSLERVMSTKKFSDSKYDFIQGSEDDQRKLCSFILERASGLSKLPTASIIERAKFADFFPVLELKYILNERGLIQHTITEVRAHLLGNFLQGLSLKCIHRGFSAEESHKMEPAELKSRAEHSEKILSDRLKKFRDDGGFDAFAEEVTSNFDHLDELVKYFPKSEPLAPGCEKFGLEVTS